MKTTCIIIVITLLLGSCDKQYDMPPLKQASQGPAINITGLYQKHRDGSSYKFKGDSNLYCVVTADESSGNLYQEAFACDATGAIHLNLLASGFLQMGDSIRINLKGIILNEDKKLVQLDSIDPEASIVKLASGVSTTTKNYDLESVITNSSALQSHRICISDIEFIATDRNQLYADNVTRTTMSRLLSNCSQQKLPVRTSGYSILAGVRTPTGNGSVTGILTQYNGSVQMLVMRREDVSMNNAICTTTSAGTYILKKDFNDNSIFSGGWQSAAVTGSIAWNISNTGSSSAYALMKNFYGGANIPCETWLISPPVDLQSSTKPVLEFKNAFNYKGDVLELYVSTNYAAGLPSTGAWTKLTFNISPGNFTFIGSGKIDLTPYKSSHTTLAFRYTGSSTSGSTWEVDDVEIREN